MKNGICPDGMLQKSQWFEQLVNQYQQPVLHMCYLCLYDKTLAEDATQETFFKVYRKMDSFQGASSEKTWIMKIAIHTCYDMNRSGWFRFFNRRVTPEMLPDPAVQTDEGEAELVKAVAALPLKTREVILLYYFQGMKVKEIAKTLSLSQSSVSGRLKRGREKLKSLLQGRELDE